MSERNPQFGQNDPSTGIVRRRQVPFIIRAVNLIALVLLGLILVPAAVVRLEQLIVVLAVPLALFIIYCMFQNNPKISSGFLALSLSVVLWIVVCENIVSIDNVLGTQITKGLRLGMRLQSFAQENLKSHKHHYIQECCHDALSWNYKPGSVHRATYDCATCNEPYESVVDPTGHLNSQFDLIENGRQADIFIAGDSVLEGTGVPSVVESLNQVLPVKIWNLSISGYGPRQKAQALIVDALTRHPKSIIIEFFAGNDLNDVIIYEGCEGSTFLCVFNLWERDRRLLRHPLFSSMVHIPKDFSGMFDEYTENNFTLAVTRYLIDNVKGAVRGIAGKSRVDVDGTEYKTGGKSGRRFSAPDVSDPGGNFDFVIRQGRTLDWLKEGMLLTQKHYDRLVAAISKLKSPPKVILLYNPSAYEIYRDIVIERDEEIDRVSEFLRKALSDYADKQGWTFLDLTAPLSKEFSETGLWIYGKHDRAHWSQQGTKAVGSVLARELSKVVGPKTTTPLHAAFGDGHVVEIGGR